MCKNAKGNVNVNRKQRREKEKKINPFKELMKTAKHFFPDLLTLFKNVKDPRNPNQTDYDADELLLVRVLGAMLGIESMRGITEQFNKDECIENLRKILGKKDIEEIPHYDTINDFLSKLDVSELENIRHQLINRLFRMKCLNEYRVFGRYWHISIDGTCVYVFNKKHCDHCLTKTFNKGTPNEKTKYFHYVLEAKLVIGDMVFSVASEFIENVKCVTEFTDEEKQDCELKAFYRLAERLKKDWPRLPICLTLDSLYANKNVFNICKENNWEYIIRFKEKSIPSIGNEFKVLAEYNNETPEVTNGVYRTVNGIDYEGHKINMVEFKPLEKEKEKAEEQTFTFIASPKLKVIEKTKEEIVGCGRQRWTIENQGFNEQKNHGYELEHPFSHNNIAMKNHYILIQIAHMIRQLFEQGMAIVKVYKSLKKTSYSLLESFRNTVLTAACIDDIHKKRQVRLNYASPLL